MTAKQFRIAFALTLVWAYFLPGWVLAYIIVWFMMLEVLNRRVEYTSLKNYKHMNLFFFLAMIFLFNRFMHLREGHQAREIINRGEHVLFSFAICLWIMQILRIKFFNTRNLTSALIITSLVFESIGFLNEVYQASWDAGHFSVYFSDDAIHDMLSNATGNVLFLLVAIIPGKLRGAVGY